MASLRDIRKKIHSINNIQKITQAMELVAASRLRKAQSKVESALPYAIKLQEILDRLIATSVDLHHPLISARQVKKIGVVVIAGDRGLCGAYNQNVFSAAEKFLRKYEPSQVELFPIGRKTVDHFELRKWKTAHPIKEWGGKITYSQVEALTKELIHSYLEGQLDEIWIIHTHFVNMTVREVHLQKFLNIEPGNCSRLKDNYLFEPNPERLLAEILPLYCVMHMQSALNDAYTSELAARISSMRAATKNAEEMIEKLTLIRNKVRQAGITKELIEITSGAESLREG